MTSYIVRRLIQTVIVIALLSYFSFYLMTLMPGDPVDLMISSNPKITADDVVRLRELYGLDQPAYKRYWNWVSTLVSGDLGYSRTYRIPVTEILGPRLLNTFYLSMCALALALAVAIPLGIYAALNAGKTTDYLINFLAFSGISLPSFFLAILLIIAFAVNIPIFPAGGTTTPGALGGGFFDRISYLVLPVISLAFLQIGNFTRFTRSAMMEAMRNDFIRTARAKGLSRRTVILQHGFRNALLPLITVIALSFSSVFSGAVITESVFAYQGVGKLLIDSILGNDFNVAMVSFLISTVMVLVMNLVADILYGVADPRISYA